MTDNRLVRYEFTAIPESEQLRFLIQLRDEPRQVEFLVPAHALTSLIETLQLAQQRYKLARDQYIQNRRKQIRDVAKDDDV